jgi:parvulin-like peptidyl-prolyl isomerase
MKPFFLLGLILSAVPGLGAWQQPMTPAPVVDDTVVLRAGSFTLTKAQYEKLVPGFQQAAGAVITGANAQTAQSALDVARVLALVTEAQRRKIDQEPQMQALIQVRGYVLLANALLLSLIEDVKKDEAGTRSLWASEKHNYIEIHARHILVRYKSVKTNESASKGLSRTQEEAKQRAASLFQKVKQGGDFAAIAKADSDDESTSKLGGELPAFTRGAMTAEFETVAFGLPVGGISEPFKTEFGYHIVRVTDHQPMPFEKVRAALENIRARQRFEELGKANVQLNDPYFKR